MSKILRIIITLCFVLCFSVSVYADTTEFDLDVKLSDYSAKISGETDRKEGTEVVVAIVRPQKNVSNIKEDSKSDESTQIFSNVLCMAQTSVDKNNEFSYTVNFDSLEKSGTYLARCQVYSEKTVREKEFEFVNEGRKKIAEAALENGTESVNDILEQYSTDLDIKSGGLYDTFTAKQKKYVADSITSAKGSKKEAYINAVAEIEKIINMKKLSKEELKKSVNDGNIPKLDSTLISRYKALSSLKQDLLVSELYSKIYTVEVPDEFNKLFTDAIKEIENSNNSNPGGGGTSSGGGGRSGSGSSGFTNIVPENNENTPSTNDIDEFDDLDSVPWAKNAILILFDKRIVSGKGDNKFCPQDEITREEFLKLVVNSLNIIGVSEEKNSFSDVVSGSWYEDTIDIAVACGIINGINENYFGVGNSITRQDMATILYRAVKYANVNLYSVADTQFLDEDEISEYAKESVSELSKAKVINGMDDGTFMPQKTATRAEAAMMIYNLLYR